MLSSDHESMPGLFSESAVKSVDTQESLSIQYTLPRSRLTSVTLYSAVGYASKTGAVTFGGSDVKIRVR